MGFRVIDSAQAAKIVNRGAAKKRAVGGVKNAFSNKANPAGRRGAKGDGGKFGTPTAAVKGERKMARATTVGPAFAVGAYGGYAGGTVAGSFGPKSMAREKTINANQKQISANSRKVRQLSKAFRPVRAQRITDLGTKAHRADEKAYRKFPDLHRRTAAAVGGGTAAFFGTTLYGGNKLGQERVISGQKRTLTRQNNRLNGTKVSKMAKEPKYTKGRAASAVAFGPYHSAVAGKQGKKLRATGRVVTEGVAGSLGGGVAGAALGVATKKPMGAAVGSQLGSQAGMLGGTYHGFRSNNKKGYYKKQTVKKNSTISAFGIEH